MTKISVFFLFIALLSIAACQNSANSGEENNNLAADTTAQTQEANKYTLTPFDPSQAYEDAAIKSMTYKGGKFNFNIGGTSYKLGVQTPDAPQKLCANSAEGQHIHLIVDDQPYAAKYTASFDYDIADGEHYLLAFLSRSYHESIKTPTAFVAQKVQITNKSIDKSEPVKDPMLFYSRPKGDYIGKDQTSRIMLDFYLVNATLGADYKVKVEVNAEQTFVVDTWQPYYLEGLPMGDNKIKLTLVDKDGNAVNTPLNPVERVFTLKEDPAE